MNTKIKTLAWAGLWHSRNALDGVSEHILHENCLPILFKTRKEARAHILKHYGYIRYREDLRQEPHGWRLPQPIRVTISACLVIFALVGCDRSMNDSWLSPPSCHKKECMEADGYNIVGSPGQ